MLPVFNCKTLKERLKKLDRKLQLAFGATCCERLLPNYLAFVKDTGWGDIKPIRHALDLIWLHLEEKTVNPQELNEMIALCESVAPDSDNFQSLYSTSAQDACFAVCALLDYLVKNDIDRIIQVATYATDSVDLYVQVIENMNPNSSDLEQKILEHRLMQRELSQQEKNLEYIEKARDIDLKFLYQLKNSWNNNGKSNLDLP
jgi:uncharacterized protein YjaG (DUF416 family)